MRPLCFLFSLLAFSSPALAESDACFYKLSLTHSYVYVYSDMRGTLEAICSDAKLEQNGGNWGPSLSPIKGSWVYTCNSGKSVTYVQFKWRTSSERPIEIHYDVGQRYPSECHAL
jgi:hypothetical protein